MLMAIHTRHSPGQIAKGYTPQKFDQDQSPWLFLRQNFSTVFEQGCPKDAANSDLTERPRSRDSRPRSLGFVRRMRQLLTDGQRADLAVMSSVVRFKKGEIIYQEGDPANAVFNLNTGVVTAFKQAPDNSEHVVAFLLADDLFGLSAEGQYTNSTRALTAVTAYRLPVTALRSRLTKDAELEFHVMCKLCQELRQAQRHAFLLSQRSAVTKLAMFLQLFEQAQIAKDESTSEIHLPMDRSDIGEYISVTLAAVSRAFRTLTTRGIIEVRDRHHVRIVDRSGFEKIAGDPPPPAMQFAMQSTID
jgi:CRP/FNR family transcriptional regulator, anaerobic regulatory protein